MMSAKCIIMSNLFKKICMEGSSIDVPLVPLSVILRICYVYPTYMVRNYKGKDKD